MRLVLLLLLLSTVPATAEAQPSDGGTPEEVSSPAEPVADAVPAADPAPVTSTEASPAGPGGRPTDPRKARITQVDRSKMLPAQPQRSRNTITINPLTLFQQQLSLEYERALSDWFTAYVSPQPTILFTGGRFEIGLLAEVGVRLVLIGKPPGGFYLAPLLAFAVSRESASGVTTTSFAVGYGGMIGLTFVFFDRIVLSGGIGARYLKLPSAPTAFPIQALPRFSVGVAF